jgi:hypothetical protein
MPEGRYRAGPWPGLTATGAAVLLGCAILLGAVQLTLGNPRRALPDLPILGATSLVPLLLGTRIVRAPGAASAICGAYLMPRTLISLVQPALDPPPLLLVPALVFDLGLWARGADLARLIRAWPRRDRIWRKRPPPVDRRSGRWRAAFAGGLYGLVLSMVEPPFALLYGADPSGWTPADLAQAAGLAVAGCALVALSVTARGTAS